jgi:hypothetical protein
LHRDNRTLSAHKGRLPLGDLVLRPRLLRHLQKEQVRELRDVLKVRDPVVTQDVAQVPELLNDVTRVGHVRRLSENLHPSARELKMRLAKRATPRGDALPLATKRTSAFDHLALLFRKRANVAIEQSKRGGHLAKGAGEQAMVAGHRTKRAAERAKGTSKRTKRAAEQEEGGGKQTKVPSKQQKVATEQRKIDG